MQNVMAFKIVPDGKLTPIGHQLVQCNMVFHIKVEVFRQRVGFWAETPTTVMYTIVLSRETVRIALMIAAFNDLQVKLSDILNLCVLVPVTEKVWTILGPEVSKDEKSLK